MKEKAVRRETEPKVPSQEVRVGMMAHVAIPGYLEWRKRRQEAAARGEPVAT